MSVARWRDGNEGGRSGRGMLAPESMQPHFYRSSVVASRTMDVAE